MDSSLGELVLVAAVGAGGSLGGAILGAWATLRSKRAELAVKESASRFELRVERIRRQLAAADDLLVGVDDLVVWCRSVDAGRQAAGGTDLPSLDVFEILGEKAATIRRSSVRVMNTGARERAGHLLDSSSALLASRDDREALHGQFEEAHATVREAIVGYLTELEQESAALESPDE